MSSTGETLLEVRNLTVRFPTIDGVVQAVSDVSFTLQRGETLGIVGESGSGKSVSNLAIMGLLNRKRALITGEILFNGRELLALPPSEMQKIRGKDIAMIFQDPFACLHPMYRVGDQIAEAATAHGIAEEGCATRGGRAPRPRRHPERQVARTRLPPPVLRRHAPARDDRDGARPQPGDPDRRRADHRARRDRPGADPAS